MSDKKDNSKKSATAEDFMNGWFNVMGKLWEDAGAGKAEDLPGAIKDVQDDIKRVRAEMQNDKSKCDAQPPKKDKEVVKLPNNTIWIKKKDGRE